MGKLTENGKSLMTKLIVILSVVLLDQISKWYVLHSITKPEESVELFSFLNLVMVLNKGISFGLLSGSYSSIIITVLANLTVFSLIFIMLNTRNNFLATAIALIIGGGIGNIIDRIRMQAVVDFLDFHIGNYHWYVFNMADAAITLGMVMIIVNNLLQINRKKASKQ